MTEQVTVPMNAARVCDAIARIGYQPHSALMDIIDNSISAGARNVQLIVDLIEGATSFNQRSNIARCRIVDDGRGMDDHEILNALKLGSDANYLARSLSKYGMGLKSAGFSLGRRIQVTSKKDGQHSQYAYVDRDFLANRSDYVVCREPMTAEQIAEFDALIPGSSGTIVDVTGCEKVTKLPARRILATLKERLGITYYGFLDAKENGVSITLKCEGGKIDTAVTPVDFLFLSEAERGYNPDNYTGKRPVLLLSEQWEPPADEGTSPAPISLTVVALPQQKMAQLASFTKEEKDRIQAYGINRDNQGFFIYRNGRLIRWGDTLDGMVGRDDITFRARIDIDTSHDDLLHVDVSKQNLEIPTDLWDALKRVMQIPLGQADKLKTVCGQLFTEAQGEGQAFNETTGTIAEQDPAEEAAPVVPPEEKKRRITRKRQETEKVLTEAGEAAPAPSEEPVAALPVFEKVRYSDKVKANQLWDAGCSETNESFARVNRNHAFYDAVLHKLDHAGSSRLAWEAALWALAVAENKTICNLDVDPEITEKVLHRFKRVFSANLEEWALANQDLTYK